jgi:CheY-like chemotaxis protein
MEIVTRSVPRLSLQVLVADDDILPQRVITLLLQRLGHAGVVVSDGAKALDCLAQRSFDVVLLDVMMPTLDGIATLAAIRRSETAQPQLTRQRVIMVTGHAEPSDRARLLNAGADGHITKPINAALFEAELIRVMQGQ